MDTYVILRRSGWKDGAELGEAAARSTAEGERMPDERASEIRHAYGRERVIAERPLPAVQRIEIAWNACNHADR